MATRGRGEVPTPVPHQKREMRSPPPSLTTPPLAHTIQPHTHSTCPGLEPYLTHRTRHTFITLRPPAPRPYTCSSMHDQAHSPHRTRPSLSDGVSLTPHPYTCSSISRRLLSNGRPRRTMRMEKPITAMAHRSCTHNEGGPHGSGRMVHTHSLHDKE